MSFSLYASLLFFLCSSLYSDWPLKIWVFYVSSCMSNLSKDIPSLWLSFSPRSFSTFSSKLAPLYYSFYFLSAVLFLQPMRSPGQICCNFCVHIILLYIIRKKGDSVDNTGGSFNFYLNYNKKCNNSNRSLMHLC